MFDETSHVLMRCRAAPRDECKVDVDIEVEEPI